MNSKKTWGIVLAAVLFLIISISGVVSAYIMQDFWSVFDYDTTDVLGDTVNTYGEDIAILYVVGSMSDLADTFETRLSGAYMHQATIAQIEEMAADQNNKGILLYLDTGGGVSQVGDELHAALMEYKELTGRPIYSYIHSVGASAGYYAACATDKIVMNRNAITGSIGVTLSITDYTGLYEKLGIEQRNYASGDLKGIVAPEHRSEEDAVYQGLVDEFFEYFIEVVMNGRDMSRQEVLELADGRIYTANQALNNGLVDGIANFDETINLIKEETGYDVYYYPNDSEMPLFDQFFATIQSIFPKSESQILTELLNDAKPMEILYEL